MISSTTFHTLMREGTDKTAPIVLWLHGVGSTNAQLSQIASLFDERLTLIAPRGANNLGQGRFAWYEVEFTPTGPVINAEQAEASRQQLISFVGELRETYQTDKIIMTGFSQGAIMSASVVLTAPDALLGAAMFSGRILSEIDPMIATQGLASKPVFVGHGKTDAMMPLSVGDANQLKLSSLGLAVTYKPYDIGHTMSPEELADFSAWALSLS